MARRRANPEDAWLPSRVYRGKSSYEWRPKGGKCVTLMRLLIENNTVVETPAIKRQVLEAYEKATAVILEPKTVDYWLTHFFLSHRFLRLSLLTQGDYVRYCDAKADSAVKGSRNGIRIVFGKMLPGKVRPHHIRRYLDYWAEAGKEVTANRHLAFLQTFFGWLREQNAGVVENPAHGVTKFPEKARRYYITDEQYEQLIEAAIKSSTPYVAPFMELAYLCGLRRHEVLLLNMEDVLHEGLRVYRGKGSEGEITEWSDRLRQAVDLAVSLHPDTPEPLRNRPLLRNTRGLRVSNSAINQAFQDVRAAAKLEHIRIHDLKKKAGSDGKDLGHMSERMRRLYNLKLAVKPATK